MLAGIAALLAWGMQPSPVLVETATVGKGPLQVWVEEEGQTRVVDHYRITAPVAGYLRRIEREVGEAVARDEVVAELLPLPSAPLDARTRATARARLEATAAAREAAAEESVAAEAEAALAEKEHRRLAALFKGGNASEEQLNRAEAALHAARARLRSSRFRTRVARYEWEAARAVLETESGESDPALGVQALRSPVAGRILARDRESAGVVEAGQPLLTIGDPRSLEVAVDLLSADAVGISPGTRVVLERWGGEPALEGAVRVIEPTGFTKVSALGVEEQRVWVIVDLLSPRDAWARLGDGYRVEARFILWEGEEVLQVPAGALFRHDGGRALFVVEGERARLRQVEPGRSSGLATEIRAGLEPGEVVIAHPDDRLGEGVRVTAR